MNESSSIAVPSRLAVTYRAVGDLIPDPRNARTHPKRQIDQIRASIEAFGFTNPVLADPDGHIIAGHGRLQAARAMGLAELPVITLSGLSEIAPIPTRLCTKGARPPGAFSYPARVRRALALAMSPPCLRSALSGLGANQRMSALRQKRPIRNGIG